MLGLLPSCGPFVESMHQLRLWSALSMCVAVLVLGVLALLLPLPAAPAPAAAAGMRTCLCSFLQLYSVRDCSHSCLTLPPPLLLLLLLQASRRACL
jgi:hypothetical protein